MSHDDTTRGSTSQAMHPPRIETEITSRGWPDRIRAAWEFLRMAANMLRFGKVKIVYRNPELQLISDDKPTTD